MKDNNFSTGNIIECIRNTGKILSEIDLIEINEDNYLELENYLIPLQKLREFLDDRYVISKNNNNNSVLLVSYILYNIILDIINNIGTDVDKDTPLEIWTTLLYKMGNELVITADSLESDDKFKSFESCSNLIRYYYEGLDNKWRES